MAIANKSMGFYGIVMHGYFFVLFADQLEIKSQLLVKSGVESLVVPSSQSVEMDFVEKNSSEKHYRLSVIYGQKPSLPFYCLTSISRKKGVVKE